MSDESKLPKSTVSGETTHKCQERVGLGSWYPTVCGAKGKVERDGRWYCGRHDPVAIKERHAAAATKRAAAIAPEIAVAKAQRLVDDYGKQLIQTAHLCWDLHPTAEAAAPWSAEALSAYEALGRLVEERLLAEAKYAAAVEDRRLIYAERAKRADEEIREKLRKTEQS